jgi:hypothetical protein
MMARNYNTAFAPYPLVSSADVLVTDADVSVFPTPVGGLVQQRDSDKVFRLVCFDDTASGDVDFTVNCVTYNYSGCVAGGAWLVRQDFSDTGGVVAGVCPQTIDLSAMPSDMYGYIQVAGSCEITNHDGTCPIGSELVSHGVDGGTTDVRATVELSIGIIVDDAGTTTPVVDLFVPGPGVMKVQDNS